MTTTTLTTGSLARPSSALLDRLRLRVAATLEDRRGDRAYRRQEQALAGMDARQRGEVLFTARR